jgi:uncharacterized membrane protein
MQNNPYEAPVADGGGGALATGRHEFSEAENKQIGETGKRSWLWGLVALATGVLGSIGLAVAFVFRGEFAQAGLDPNWVTIFIVAVLPFVAVNLLSGFFYMGAGNSLKAVVKTQGSDVQHMIASLSKLGSAFLIDFLVGTLMFVGSFALGVALAVYKPDFSVEEEGSTEESTAEEVEDFDD